MTALAITQVATVVVPVADPDRALGFYAGTLGFDTRLDGDLGGGRRWIEVAPAGSACGIALVAGSGAAPLTADTAPRLATSDAAADHAALRAAGADVDEEIMRWPGVPPMFTLRDPDGNVLVLVER